MTTTTTGGLVSVVGGLPLRATADGWCELIGVLGGHKAVGRGHPCRDGLDGVRVRIHAVVPDWGGTWLVEVTDDDGRVLPDLRHPSQVRAY